MQEDDETSATQLLAKLASLGVYVSLTTIVRSRVQLGWTYHGSAYCQLIRHQNKEKQGKTRKNKEKQGKKAGMGTYLPAR